ncbi:hypothetical protein [Phenylobacterium sp.]|uniref:hypothetical protein n=1 Tax=Phenylobacterium sp. TaxID=1871053 RepID=UPI0035B11F72
MAGSDLVERGCVTVISVEAIQERAGDRWPRRRDDVWAYVARKLDEHLSHQDIRQRLNETDFLIGMTQEEGVAAQAVSLKILEEVLVFFLGSADPADFRVRSVSRIDGMHVSAAELDPTRIAVARQKIPETGGPSPYRREIDPEEERKRNPVSFVTAGGETMSVHFALEHVVSLRHNVTAALRVQPTVSRISTGHVVPSRHFSRLTDDEIAFIDRSALDFASLFMPKDSRSQPPLIVPASFRSLGGRKGRRELVGREDITAEQIKRSLFIELIDVDRGTPPGRLAEVNALVSALSRGVFVRLQPVKRAASPVRDVRLRGLTLDASDLVGFDSHLARLLVAVSMEAKGLSPALVVQGLPSADYFGMAQVAGFTHAGRRAVAATAGERSAA